MCPVNITHAAPEISRDRTLFDDPSLLKTINESDNLLRTIQDLGLDKRLLEDFLEERSRELREGIIQVQNYSVDCAVKAPPVPPSRVERAGSALSGEDLEELAMWFRESMDRGTKGALTEKKVGGAKAAEVPLDSAQQAPQAPDTSLDVWRRLQAGTEDYLITLQDIVMETQFKLQFTKKKEETEEEIQKMVQMVRSGKADAVFILLALTKATATLNGFLSTFDTKEMWKLEQKNINEMKVLETMNVNDPEYLKELQIKSQSTKTIGTQQSILSQNIQTYAQNIQKAFSFGNEGIKNILTNREGIIRHLSGNA